MPIMRRKKAWIIRDYDKGSQMLRMAKEKDRKILSPLIFDPLNQLQTVYSRLSAL